MLMLINCPFMLVCFVLLFPTESAIQLFNWNIPITVLFAMKETV